MFRRYLRDVVTELGEMVAPYPNTKVSVSPRTKGSASRSPPPPPSPSSGDKENAQDSSLDDSNGSASRSPPAAEAVRTSPETPSREGLLESEHQLTPNRDTRSESAASSAIRSPGETPPASTTSSLQEECDAGILQAAKDTTARLKSPELKVKRHEIDKFFKLFHPVFFEKFGPDDERLTKRLDSMRQRIEDDESLLFMRTHEKETDATRPPGFTPLMLAAHHGLLPAIDILLEHQPKKQLMLRNRDGETALHIASSAGNEEVLEWLLAAAKKCGCQQAIVQNVDSLGRTALASGLLSPGVEKDTRDNIEKQLRKVNPKDTALFGHPEPPEKREHSSDSVAVTVGKAELNGRRVEMEDTILVDVTKEQRGFVVVGVFDGHQDAGAVSKFASEQVSAELGKFLPEDISNKMAFQEAFLNVDESIQQKCLPGGSTGVVAAITKERVAVANVGDSRCILVQWASGHAVAEDRDDAGPVVVTPLSVDHKPSLPAERERIENAGMVVENGKVKLTKNDGSTDWLGTSRAFGDHDFKQNRELPPNRQAVAAVPELLFHDRTDADAFLILACDGVWDTMSNDEVGNFVVEEHHRTEGVFVLPRVADKLLEHSLDEESTDNMSVCIVDLSGAASRELEFIEKSG